MASISSSSGTSLPRPPSRRCTSAVRARAAMSATLPKAPSMICSRCPSRLVLVGQRRLERARILDTDELARPVRDLVVAGRGLARAYGHLRLAQTRLDRRQPGRQPLALGEVADSGRHVPAPQPTIPSSSSNSSLVIEISRADDAVGLLVENQPGQLLVEIDPRGRRLPGGQIVRQRAIVCRRTLGAIGRTAHARPRSRAA